MKRLIWLIVIAAVAYGGYLVWKTDGEVLNDYVGKDNVDEARSRLASLAGKESKPETVDSLAATWLAVGPAVYLRSGNPVGSLSADAVSAIAENELVPYYDRMRLGDTRIEFSDAGHFVIFVHDVPVEGVLEKVEGNEYDLTLRSSQIEIPESYSHQRAYLRLKGERMTLTVDVKKLLGLVSALADQSDKATFKTAMRLTRQYDNVCLGFHFKRK